MPPEARRPWSSVAIPIALAALVIVPHADLLVASLADPHHADVLAGPDQDLQRSFGHWRAYSAHEWGLARIAWWNPFAYAGAPFLGNFQSAVLYPSTLLYLAFPTPLALNADVLLHLWWAGLGAACWARRRGSTPSGQLLAGTVVALGGPAVQLAASGHLSHLLAFAWAPWVLEARERTASAPSRRAVGRLAVATGMMLLAGNPQIAYVVGVVAATLSVADLARRDLARSAAVGAGLGLGVALAAAQWLPGLECSAESARDRALPRDAAAKFSLPPENAFTLVAPGLLGDQRSQMYWGRSALHEAEGFTGAAALALALVALLARDRAALASAGLTAGALSLALGVHASGWFDALRTWLPGYDRLRAPGRALTVAHLGLALAAARGLDLLGPVRGLLPAAREPSPVPASTSPHAPRTHRAVVWITAALGLALAIVALACWLAPGADGPVARAFSAVVRSGEASMPRRLYDYAPMRELASRHAAGHAATAAVALALAALLVAKPRLRAGLLAFALIELVVHATWFRRHAPFVPGETDPEVAAHFARELGDGRIHDQRELSNRGASSRHPQLWGLGPEVSRRYHELFARTQGADPTVASEEDLGLVRLDRRLALARLRFVVTSPEEPGFGLERVLTTPSSWVYDAAPRPEARVPRFRLVDRWERSHADRDVAIDRLLDSDVIDGRVVLLEQAPEPAPATGPGPPGTMTWRETSPAEIALEVVLSRPALLVASDAWRGGWHAVDALGKPHEVLPANHAFLAVALPAGTHGLTLRYAPRSQSMALAISAAAAVAVLVLGALRRDRA